MLFRLRVGMLAGGVALALAMSPFCAVAQEGELRGRATVGPHSGYWAGSRSVLDNAYAPPSSRYVSPPAQPPGTRPAPQASRNPSMFGTQVDPVWALDAMTRR